jgi:16S rRNA (cytidine1402-2'-O)-methyltransferase
VNESKEADGGTLWVVATPIGTLEDLGSRAVRVLADVDLILAEDTRRTRRLLTHAGISAGGRLQSLHEHNERERIPGILEEILGGRSAALVSDAGTPAISDPGYLLVRAARSAGLRICSVPGASVFTAALAAAGQPPLPAALLGFLPARRGPRRRRIAEFSGWTGTIVVLLSPHRISAELADLAEELGGDREATLLAELSKLHERGSTGTLDELADSDEVAMPRGEYVVVIGPGKVQRAGDIAVDPELVGRAYQDAVANGLDRPSALRRVAAELGLRRREVYAMLLDAERRSKGHD